MSQLSNKTQYIPDRRISLPPISDILSPKEFAPMTPAPTTPAAYYYTSPPSINYDYKYYNYAPMMVHGQPRQIVTPRQQLSPPLAHIKPYPNTYLGPQIINAESSQITKSSKSKTRNNLPKETTHILLSWLNDHLNHPYPNSLEKNELMNSTGLNQQQLSNWFINARRRKIKMLKEEKKFSC